MAPPVLLSVMEECDPIFSGADAQHTYVLSGRLDQVLGKPVGRRVAAERSPEGKPVAVRIHFMPRI